MPSDTPTSSTPDVSSVATPKANKGLRAQLKRWVPWLITALCLFYLFSTSDFNAMWRTLQQVSLLHFILAVTVVSLLTYVLDSYGLLLLFRRFHGALKLSDALVVKGASYLLKLLNYNASTAGIALFLRNRKGVSLLTLLSSMLWLNIVDLVTLATMVLLGLQFGSVTLAPKLYYALWYGACGVWLLFLGSLLYWRAGWNFLFLGKLRDWRIFSTFAKATLWDYAVMFCWRSFFIAGLFLIYAWILPLFGIYIPTMALLLYVPALIFIGTIPLTNIAGLGTVQLVMRELFVPFASQGAGQVDAYSTTTFLCFVLSRVLIALPFMSRVSFSLKAPPTPEVEVETETSSPQ